MVEDESAEGGLPFNLDKQIDSQLLLGCMDFIYLVNSSTFNNFKSTTRVIKAFPQPICPKVLSVDV